MSQAADPADLGPRDTLGARRLFGVVVPSTNTVVQTEYEAMRPPGVTNHVGRFMVPDLPIADDAGFLALIDAIRATMDGAIDQLVTCAPDHLILGMSVESFWDGLDASRALQARLEARAGRDVTLGSEALLAALGAHSADAAQPIRRLGVVTPYMPVGDEQVRRFLTSCGFEIVALEGLKSTSPRLTAHITEARLRDAILAVDSRDVQAIVQVGTNLPMGRVAAIAEFWLGKPVIAVNTATYWHALRTNGIDDRLQGHGRLLAAY